MNILKRFNLSYSALSTYKTSQLQFYFEKIKKAEPSDETMQVYGDGGNVVHKAFQDSIEKQEDTFDQHWIDYKIDEQSGFHGTKLSKKSYLTMYHKALQFYNKTMSENTIIGPPQCELKLEKQFFGINVKAYLDIIYNNNETLLIQDWKTNTTSTYIQHKLQRLFYSWFIWKVKNTIPRCEWVYLNTKTDIPTIQRDYFSPLELVQFEHGLESFVKSIVKKGDDITKYSPGNYKNPFNQYRTLCHEEAERRLSPARQTVYLNIRGNFVFLEGFLPQQLLDGIDFKTRFDLPDKYYMQQRVKKTQGGYIHLEEVGRVHLYNRKFKCFPVGFLRKIVKIIREYAFYYDKAIEVIVIDCRNQKIMDQQMGVMPEKLCTDKVFREYQNEAICKFFTKRNGIINIATGGGKTLIAAEIMRMVDARTLWIIDRKELLKQTKDVLEELFGFKLGEVSGGMLQFSNVTIATIQTLHNRLPQLQEYLKTVNFVVIDEYHKSAAETYQKVFAKLPNTKYRLGLTATVKRDDGKTPILHSILGDVIHKTNSKKLIRLGYLVKPKIEFIDVGSNTHANSYPMDYEENIVNSLYRNYQIENICKLNTDKKILILTKSVVHGGYLLKDIICSAHIHGSTNKKDREFIMQDFKNNNTGVLILTQSIGAEGLDIPDLDIIINAAANAGNTKSIQTLGRVLRIFKGKSEARYIDFLDGGRYTRKHSEARINAFKEQGHEVDII